MQYTRVTEYRFSFVCPGSNVHQRCNHNHLSPILTITSMHLLCTQRELGCSLHRRCIRAPHRFTCTPFCIADAYPALVHVKLRGDVPSVQSSKEKMQLFRCTSLLTLRFSKTVGHITTGYASKMVTMHRSPPHRFTSSMYNHFISSQPFPNGSETCGVQRNEQKGVH